MDKNAREKRKGDNIRVKIKKGQTKDSFVCVCVWSHDLPIMVSCAL